MQSRCRQSADSGRPWLRAKGASRSSGGHWNKEYWREIPEVILPSPAAAAPERPRRFGLGRLHLDTRPTPPARVVRSVDIHAATAACSEPPGNIEPLSRAALDWLTPLPMAPFLSIACSSADCVAYGAPPGRKTAGFWAFAAQTRILPFRPGTYFSFAVIPRPERHAVGVFACKRSGSALAVLRQKPRAGYLHVRHSSVGEWRCAGAGGVH